MLLVLDEDQELLAKTAADYAAEKSPLLRMRALRDERDETGFSRSLWKEMGELGWLGIPFEEVYGGADLGLAELCIVIEALGRKLAPEPFLSALLLGGRVLARGGSDAQKEAWLSKLVAGDALVSLAHQEPGARYDLAHVETRAERSAEGWSISGRKTQVLDGHAADLLLIPARTAGAPADRDGITLFAVERGAAGLDVERQWRVDSRGAAQIVLEQVSVPDTARVGAEGQATQLLEEAVDAATVGLCAEMLGGMSEVFERTLDHLKQREQFGVVIGTFQALKHRAARVFIEIELARSTVMAAARAFDSADAEAAKLVSLAKARCSDAYVLIANEAVQMFGGVGMTDEYDIGFYMKRARAAELTFGDSAWHRDRWAHLSGY